MGFNNIFGIHEKALTLRAERNEVLASNLANADTPGYKARDFDFKKMLNKEMTTSRFDMATTHKSHIPGKSTQSSPFDMQYRIPQQPSLDGNTVEVEREQVEYSANALKYQATLRFLDGSIKGLKTAIKGSSQ